MADEGRIISKGTLSGLRLRADELSAILTFKMHANPTNSRCMSVYRSETEMSAAKILQTNHVTILMRYYNRCETCSEYKRQLNDVVKLVRLLIMIIGRRFVMFRTKQKCH